MKIDSMPPAAMLTSNWSRCSSQTTQSFTGGSGAPDWVAAEAQGAEAEAAPVAGARESAGSPNARAVGAACAACAAAGTAVRVAPIGCRKVTMSSKRVRERVTDICPTGAVASSGSCLSKLESSSRCCSSSENFSRGS